MFHWTDLLRAAWRDLTTPYRTARLLRAENDALYRHANRLVGERDAALAELAAREAELAEHIETAAWVAAQLETYQRRERTVAQMAPRGGN